MDASHHNPFEVLELDATASARDVVRQKDKLLGMLELGLDVRCHYYDGMPHTFIGEGNDLFIAEMISFFDEMLK